MRPGEIVKRIRAALRPRPARPPRAVDIGGGDHWVLHRGRWELRHATPTDEEWETLIDRYRKAGLL